MPAFASLFSEVRHVPIKEKNDIKIFILYLLRNIPYPLSFSNINDIVVQDGVVNYFDFITCFAELLETGNIAELRREGECVYQITEQGVHVADTLQSNILPQIREKSLQSALRLLSFQKRGAKVVCSSEPLLDGTWRVECAITEPGADLLRIQMRVESRCRAEEMIENFRERPEVMFRGAYALLTGKVNFLVN